MTYDNNDDFKQFESLVSPQADVYEIVRIPTSASSMMDHLANCMYLAIRDISYKELTFTEELVKQAFRMLIDFRVSYVSNCKMPLQPKEIEYPAILGAVLQAIGKYEDSPRGISFLPVVDRATISKSPWLELKGEELPVRMPSGGIVETDWKWMDKDKFLKSDYYIQFKNVISILKRFGVPMVYGLPMDRFTDTNDLFLMDIVEDTYLKGVNPIAPKGASISIRLLLQMKFLSELYGEARVLYSVTRTFESAFESLIQRTIRGPSRIQTRA